MRDKIKYYLRNNHGFTTEITQKKFYSLARRKNAHISICCNNADGTISSKYLKFY